MSTVTTVGKPLSRILTGSSERLKRRFHVRENRETSFRHEGRFSPLFSALCTMRTHRIDVKACSAIVKNSHPTPARCTVCRNTPGKTVLAYLSLSFCTLGPATQTTAFGSRPSSTSPEPTGSSASRLKLLSYPTVLSLGYCQRRQHAEAVGLFSCELID